MIDHRDCGWMTASRQWPPAVSGRAAAAGAPPRARVSWSAHLRDTVPMSIEIVSLDGAVAAELSTPEPDRLVSGTPQLQLRNFFSDGSQQFFAGRWSATRGKWRVRYTENELCVMTAGRVIIESTSGSRRSFGAGDAFVVPAGFAGTWEVVEDCAKVYAIFEEHP
ncbi:MAG: DUF861 domain-containing protein [Proteobacteria bacterium]|nr:DUF861 domain-containing protein [Pseudomonadota bacterium]